MKEDTNNGDQRHAPNVTPIGSPSTPIPLGGGIEDRRATTSTPAPQELKEPSDDSAEWPNAPRAVPTANEEQQRANASSMETRTGLEDKHARRDQTSGYSPFRPQGTPSRTVGADDNRSNVERTGGFGATSPGGSKVEKESGHGQGAHAGSGANAPAKVGLDTRRARDEQAGQHGAPESKSAHTDRSNQSVKPVHGSTSTHGAADAASKDGSGASANTRSTTDAQRPAQRASSPATDQAARASKGAASEPIVKDDKDAKNAKYAKDAPKSGGGACASEGTPRS